MEFRLSMSEDFKTFSNLIPLPNLSLMNKCFIVAVVICIVVIYLLFIYLLFSHNKDYTSITLYKDVARGPQKTTRLVRGGPLVTIILSNRTITTHNNGQYKTHYRYSRKSKTFVLNDCNVKIEVTEFGKEFQILGPWNKIENCLVLVRQA